MRKKQAMRTSVAAAMTCAALLAVTGPSRAEAQYPDRMVRIVVPFSAGSITDGLARLLADKLSEKWKQQVIVENKPGLPGTASVASAPGDGYTLMVTSNGHTIAGTLNKNLSFDPVKDFSGITKIASVPQIAVVPYDSKMASLNDFIAAAKQDPGKLNFASAGISSTTFLCAELMRQAANINIVHVPYKGTPEATTATIRGDTQLYLNPIPLTQQMVADKKLRAIAVNAPKRVPQFSELATFSETLPGYVCDSWFAVLAHAKTPRDIVNKVSADIREVLGRPDVMKTLDTQGAVPAPTSPEELDTQIRSESDLYGKVLRDAGIAPK